MKAKKAANVILVFSTKLIDRVHSPILGFNHVFLQMSSLLTRTSGAKLCHSLNVNKLTSFHRADFLLIFYFRKNWPTINNGESDFSSHYGGFFGEL